VNTDTLKVIAGKHALVEFGVKTRRALSASADYTREELAA
jgi:hypothetical protein